MTLPLPLVALLALSCKHTTPIPVASVAPVADTHATLDGRTIDLRAHLEGYPWEPVLVIPEASTLLIDHVGSERSMRALPIGDGPVVPESATAVGSIDWDARSRWDVRWVPAANQLYYLGDERNDEVLNVWRVPLDTGVPQKLTDEPYTYGFGVSPDGTVLASIARRGDGPYTSCLVLSGLDGASDRREVLCDTPEVQLTWSEIAFAPDGSGVVVSVDVAGARDQANLAWIPFDQPHLALLLPPDKRRFDSNSARTFVSADEIAFFTDDSGFDQVAVANVRNGAIRRFPALDREIVGLTMVGSRIVVLGQRPDGGQLLVLDPADGKVLQQVDLEGDNALLGDDGQSAVWVRQGSPDSPLAVQKVQIGGAATPIWEVPADVRQGLVSCSVEAVRVPTFDIDPATGATRQLHAYLYTPIDPPPMDRALVRITAFYGGEPAWSDDTQIMCDAGVATLSPAVRGSRGFGAEFYALNDKDLGGNEIADLFAAARWLEGRGYQRGRVGVYGGSHGGYATMRALTFPPGTDGHTDDVYPFAFGMAHAGFSDILTFYAETNIPDWVELEAGDPAKESAKLADRSPLRHVDLLTVPLFLSHGANDNRVPTSESRQMKAARDAAGKECTYAEFPGQGHHIEGTAALVELYRARFSYLDRVLAR